MLEINTNLELNYEFQDIIKLFLPINFEEKDIIINHVLTENDIPSPPKIVGMKEYYSMDRLSPEQIDQYNSGAYDSYSDETGNIYVAVDNVVD